VRTRAYRGRSSVIGRWIENGDSQADFGDLFLDGGRAVLSKFGRRPHFHLKGAYWDQSIAGAGAHGAEPVEEANQERKLDSDLEELIVLAVKRNHAPNTTDVELVAPAEVGGEGWGRSRRRSWRDRPARIAGRLSSRTLLPIGR